MAPPPRRQVCGTHGSVGLSTGDRRPCHLPLRPTQQLPRLSPPPISSFSGLPSADLSPWPDFSGVRAALASPAMLLACPHGPWVQHGTPWRHTASNQGPAPPLPAQRPQASLVTSLTKGCSETGDRCHQAGSRVLSTYGFLFSSLP